VSVSGEREEEETEEKKSRFVSWPALKDLLTAIIKSGPRPRYMKVVFSVKDDNAVLLHANAQALFLNLIYENNTVRFTTATAQKQFVLDKTLDTEWDNYITAFFKKHNVNVKTESD
jgi:hypothetical protein